MPKIVFLGLLIFAGSWLCGCVADQEDPYADDEGPQIDWPSSDPNRYHWDGLQDPYFEGWFFRVTLPEIERSFIFLYGVRNPGAIDAREAEAFLMAGGNDGLLVHQRFDPDAFQASKQRLDVQINHNRATATRITGAVRDDENKASWDLEIAVDERWTYTMGFLTNIPYLPINWYVGELRAEATGQVTWNDRTYQIKQAPFFQDHNWGSLFPESYAWLQANNFSNPTDAVAFAGGPIGLLTMGMLVWRHGENLYEIRSQDLNNLVTICPDADQGQVEILFYQGKDLFQVIGRFSSSPLIDMPAPTLAGFDPYSLMALSGRIEISRYVLQSGLWDLQEHDASEMAGVEIGGEYLTDDQASE